VSEVLVLRALGLGDLLTGVPALRGLRRAWPEARLVLAGPDAVGRWLTALGVVDDVAPTGGLDRAPPVATAPDVAVNLHGSGPQSHRVLAGLAARRLVGFRCPEVGFTDGPEWDPDEHEVERWLRLSRWVGGRAGPEDLRLDVPAADGPRDHVVVHPGAASLSRRWPTDRWAAVAGALVRAGHRVEVTGTPGEAHACAAVASGAGGEDHCGRHDLPGLAATVAGARLVLSGDTGIAHLATATGTPSVTLFGPVSPALWGPCTDTDRHVPLWRGTAGDLRPGDPHGSEPDPRLLALGVEEVLAAAERLLETGQAVRASTASRPASSVPSSSRA
jgi:ADP-heptose:LPS heptosyltransferase